MDCAGVVMEIQDDFYKKKIDKKNKIK